MTNLTLMPENKLFSNLSHVKIDVWPVRFGLLDGTYLGAVLTQCGTKNVFVSFNYLTIKFCVARELKQRRTCDRKRTFSFLGSGFLGKSPL